ncbi:MAG: hypothetical protein ABIH90_01110 [Candidatus Aenigmatarchaeota archaeon]
MNHSIRVGFSFGLTSGVITTLGLMVGLQSGTNSRLAVIGGLLTIAIADALSDSLGIHVSEEAECRHSSKEVWESTLATFASKFLLALSFLIPVLLFELPTAMLVAIAWGIIVLVFLSMSTARREKKNSLKATAEHVGIAILVVLITHYLGLWVSSVF